MSERERSRGGGLERSTQGGRAAGVTGRGSRRYRISPSSARSAAAPDPGNSRAEWSEAGNRRQILEEYYRLSLTQDYLAQGGEKYARSLLMKAFGNEGAKALLEQVNRAQVLTANQMDALQKANPKELARFLEGEQPQTIALILAYLDAKAASAC